MYFLDRLQHELVIVNEFVKDIKWILGKAFLGLYYSADLLGQTLSDGAVIQEMVDYIKNKFEDENDSQFNTEMKLGICLSLIASIPFTLTVISVARNKQQVSQSSLLLQEQRPFPTLEAKQIKHLTNFDPHSHTEHHKRHFMIRAIILVTRPAPFFALVYGSTNEIAHTIIKNKMGKEIAIQLFCISLSGINAKNRYQLHTHHANAREGYFDLLKKLPFRKKVKGICYTVTLALGHGFEGWFEVGYGLDALLHTAVFFGLPEYRWLQGLALIANTYFSGSMLIDATRTEGRSILLNMMQDDKQHANHWFTTVWLWLARIPHGLMPALGSIEFLNLLYCMSSSEFENLTPECTNNLTDRLDFIPRMMVFALASILFGYGGAEGFYATCREPTDQFVRRADTTARQAATELKTKFMQCYANFFPKKKEEDIAFKEDNDIELASFQDLSIQRVN